MMLKIQKLLVVFLLAILTIILAWTFLRGQQSQPLSTPTVIPEADFKLNIPQKALWRNHVFVSAETTPGTNCALTYVPPSGEVLVMDTTADANGLCEWRWKIEPIQGKGSGRLIFTIDGISETHFMEIRSAF
jgi:hypothetical protein